MEIIIRIEESGKFSVEKSDDLPVFTAIGMLELTKSIMLKENVTTKLSNELEGQVEIEEVIE